MIPLIYMIVFVAFVLIGFSFWFRDYAFGAIGSMLIMAIGIYTLVQGLAGVNDFLTTIYGCVLIGTGAYILIRGGIEAASA